ncbi:ribosome assembly RNA-binding protein YhbY [Aquisalimonas lutea]|uniref:ribosome assembly RNA-binding protein YhbY n=1 Tax=Aquisalimonas lutea TaxID=1327750 RepID=UPI0025B62308|nr:ribosome assembly RNA-binding protein YhbY [Aquisalimonas lutea]MDN3518832.1 ribosome assembly RNA-binding protein YhbY [Aquisalimonas lutea]
MHLNQQQKRHLRRLGHSLKPVVLTGAAGLTPNVMHEIDEALDAHELVKVKIVADDRDERKERIDTICRESEAALVQSVGNIALLFRRSRIEKKRRIALP